MNEVIYSGKLEVRVTTRHDIVADPKNAVIIESRIILHHPNICQSKYFRLAAFLRYSSGLSVAEIAGKIMKDDLT